MMSREELCKLEKCALIERVLCLQDYIEALDDWNTRMWLELTKDTTHE